MLLLLPNRFQEDEGAPESATSGRASAGYTLFVPMSGGTTYLLDETGAVAHTWESPDPAAGALVLLENGHLLRAARAPRNLGLPGGGQGGRLQELDRDGNVVWSFELVGERYSLHHDIEPTPHGTILAIAWEKKSPEEALAAGRDPEGVQPRGFWPDVVVEIEPTPPSGGRIVWEWHAFDHLVQDRSPERANHGVVRDHPELLDVNCDLGERAEATQPELDELRATGYVGGESDESSRRPPPPDWLHTNAIAYDPARDVILLGSRNLSEVWVIDHSTTVSEAAGHAGGRYGRGGDLLARWGNPANHGQSGERLLFHPHDAHWIPEGLPGAGHVLLFDNGPRPSGSFSRVLEFHLALPGEDPDRPSSFEPAWSCDTIDGETFFSSHLSGAQRLANGNTLVTIGSHARLAEITPDGTPVWQYRHQLRAGELALAGAENPADSAGSHGPARAGIFRATRIQPDHPGPAALLGR